MRRKMYGGRLVSILSLLFVLLYPSMADAAWFRFIDNARQNGSWPSQAACVAAVNGQFGGVGHCEQETCPDTSGQSCRAGSSCTNGYTPGSGSCYTGYACCRASAPTGPISCTGRGGTCAVNCYSIPNSDVLQGTDCGGFTPNCCVPNGATPATATCIGNSTRRTGSCRTTCGSTEQQDGVCKAAGGSCCVLRSSTDPVTPVAGSGGTCAGTCRTGTSASACQAGEQLVNGRTCPSATQVCCETAEQTATPTGGGAAASVTFTNPLAFDTVQGATGVFLDAFQGIIVMLALIFIVLGGILYITSGGNEKKAEGAKKMLFAAMIGLAIGVAAPSFLKEIGNILGWGGADVPDAVNSARSATEVAQAVLDFLLSIVGLLAMIMLVIGGLMYFAAAGDEKRADTAKGIVKYSIMGIALAIVSLIIVRTIAGLF